MDRVSSRVLLSVLSIVCCVSACGGGLRGTGSRMVNVGIEEQLSQNDRQFDLSWFRFERTVCAFSTLDNDLRLTVHSEFGVAKREPGDACGFYLPVQASAVRALFSSRRNISGTYELWRYTCTDRKGQLLSKDLLLGREVTIPVPKGTPADNSYLELQMRFSDSDLEPLRVKISTEKVSRCIN